MFSNILIYLALLGRGLWIVVNVDMLMLLIELDISIGNNFDV